MGFLAKITVSSALLATCLAPMAHAQSVAEVLEKARGEARESSEFRAALNDPDQNVRLAVFSAMANHQNGTLRTIAIETGLSSTDSIMRAIALKSLVMGLTQLHVHLTPDPSSSKEAQAQVSKTLAERSDVYVIELKETDNETGVFKGSANGQVSGTELRFTGVNGLSGALSLQDDNTLKGKVNLYGNATIGTVKLR